MTTTMNETEARRWLAGFALRAAMAHDCRPSDRAIYRALADDIEHPSRRDARVRAETLREAAMWLSDASSTAHDRAEDCMDEATAYAGFEVAAFAQAAADHFDTLAAEAAKEAQGGS